CHVTACLRGLHVAYVSHFYTSFFFWYVRHPDLPSFPTRRSSDLGAAALGRAATARVMALRPDGDEVRLRDGQAVEGGGVRLVTRSEEHTSELQSLAYLVCRLLLEKKKNTVKDEEEGMPRKCSWLR